LNDPYQRTASVSGIGARQDRFHDPGYNGHHFPILPA
jgi:hypothetical protein